MNTKKTILITGAAGFIASHISDIYINNNFAVIGVDNLRNGNKRNVNKKLTFLNLDLNNTYAVKTMLKKYKPEIIIHQASNLVDVELSIKHPVQAYQDLLMTTNLVEEAVKQGLQHVIFASSANVYGNPLRTPIKESARLQPLSPYGLTKLAIENHLRYATQRYNIKATIFRYFNVYGERQNMTTGAAIPTFITQMLRNESVTVRGGNQMRDFIYVEDVAEVNFLAGTKTIAGTFNVGSGESITINEIVKLLGSLTRKKNKIAHGEQDASDLQFSQASIAKISKKFDWQPQTSLRKGLKRTIEYYSHAIAKKK